MKKTITFLTTILFLPAFAETQMSADFDSLGGNKILLEKAKALNPDTEFTIVQERMVPRRKRFEIAPEISGTFGGDTYTKTSSFGLNAHFHFTPQWSVGVKHNIHFNRLTAEGEAMFDRALKQYQANPQNPNMPLPEIDYPLNESFALINWYPIYGKMNLLDRGVAHFDMYLLAGLGQVELHSGATNSSTAGAGIGVWWTNKFSSRIEMRYQNYTAKYSTGDIPMDLGLFSVQMGWLL